MPLTTIAGLALGIAVILVAIYHFAFVAPRLKAIGRTLRGDDDNVDGDSLARLRFSHEAFEKSVDSRHEAFETSTRARLNALESAVHNELLKIGFLRFNAFADVGSDLSYAIALLNEQGDGVVLTSIYSREDTRTYGKAVRRFVTTQGASKEEQTAISMTRQNVGVGAG